MNGEETIIEDGAGRRGQDKELLIVGRIVRMLEDLDEPARGRCIEYLHDRYVRYTMTGGRWTTTGKELGQ